MKPPKAKRILCYVAGSILLAAFALLGLLQVPELRFDLSGDVPVAIDSPEQLADLDVSWPRFVAIRGKGDFRRAFERGTHGLNLYYFTIHPYGTKVIVSTDRKPEDSWRQFDCFVGKLKPLNRQAFSRSVREVYERGLEQYWRARLASASRPATTPATQPTVGEPGDPDLPPIPLDELNVAVPPDAYALSLYETPGKHTVLHVTAIGVCVVISVLSVWLLYIRIPRRLVRKAAAGDPSKPPLASLDHESL